MFDILSMLFVGFCVREPKMLFAAYLKLVLLGLPNYKTIASKSLALQTFPLYL